MPSPKASTAASRRSSRRPAASETSLIIESESSSSAANSTSCQNVPFNTYPHRSRKKLNILDPGGYTYLIGANGTASGTISKATDAATWLSGSYTVTEIMVTDTNDIMADYHSDGTVTYPLGGTGPSTHSISFASLGFTLAGGQSSIVAPLLNAFSIAAPTTIPAGGNLTFDYNVTLGTMNALTEIDVLVVAPNLGQQNLIATSDLSSGTMTVATGPTWTPG